MARAKPPQLVGADWDRGRCDARWCGGRRIGSDEQPARHPRVLRRFDHARHGAFPTPHGPQALPGKITCSLARGRPDLKRISCLWPGHLGRLPQRSTRTPGVSSPQRGSIRLPLRCRLDPAYQGAGTSAAARSAIRLSRYTSLLYNALYMAARRTQIYLTAEQRRRLDERRRRDKRTLAELVREALDAYLADRRGDAATALDSTFAALPRLVVPNRDDWNRG